MTRAAVVASERAHAIADRILHEHGAERLSVSIIAFDPDVRLGDVFRVVQIEVDETETAVTLEHVERSAVVFP